MLLIKVHAPLDGELKLFSGVFKIIDSFGICDDLEIGADHPLELFYEVVRLNHKIV